MKTKLLFNNILTKGAILGCLMLASHTAKLSMLIYGGTLKWLGVMCLEMIAVMVLFVYLLYRYTKQYTGLINKMQMSQGRPMKFSYANGLCYIIAISTLAGVIVGVGDFVFHKIIGHEVFIQRIMEIFSNMISGMGTTSDMPTVREQIDEFNKKIMEIPNPTLFDCVFGSMWNYMFSGLILGLIIAAFTRQEAQPTFTPTDSEDNDTKDE